MRLRATSIIGIQLAGGLVGFLAWAALGHVSVSLLADGSRSLAIGMIVYLPLTLGIGPMLPNYFRGETPQEASTARALVRISLGVALVVAAGGTLLALVVPVVGVAVVFAAFVATSALLQQLARIRVAPLLMTLGSAYNGVLPGALAILALMDVGGGVILFVVAVVILLLQALLSLLIWVLVRSVSMTAATADAGSALGTAALLIPHMLAFAVITQGVRIPTLFGGDAAIVVQTNVVMLIVGLALAVISAVGTQLSATLQRCAADDAPRVAVRNATIMTGVGLLGSPAVVVAYLIAAPWLFPYAEPLGAVAIALMAALPPLFCAYFSATAVLLRYRRTSRLSAVSVPIAALFVIASVIMATSAADIAQLIGLFVVASIVLCVSVMVLACRTAPQWRIWGRFAGLVAASVLPPSVSVVVISLSSL